MESKTIFISAVSTQTMLGKGKHGATMTTLREAELYAAENGIVLSPSDREKIRAAQMAEADRLRAIPGVESSAAGFVERFNRFYPELLRGLARFGEVILTLAQTVIVAFGVPIVLILLLIVEHQRVLHGIALFEVDAALASFAALALVVANLVLEFTIHFIESREGYHAERSTRWSLRTWIGGAKHTLGIGKHWTPVELSPAQRYRRLLSLITFTILSLALAGSMHSVIEGQSGAWYDALISIVTASTLGEITTWAGGLLFAAAAVLSAQGLSRYVALRTAEIVAGMSTQQDTPESRYDAEIDEAGANVVLALVNARIKQEQDKRTAKARPIGSPAPTLDEPANITHIDPLPKQNGLRRTVNGSAVNEGVLP